MSKIKLILGTYNSQPLGTSNDEFEKAYQECYKPFLTLMYNFPDIPITMYYSGILFQWIEEKHPEFIMLLNGMIKKKKVELLGGAFYEPMLPMITNSDRLGQIEFLTTFIRKRVGKKPRGGWIPANVWETSLTATLKNSGFDYIFLLDKQFNKEKLGKDIFQPFITEDLGKTLIVYPISSYFTNNIGEKNPSVFLDEIIQHASKTEISTISLLIDGNLLGKSNKNKLLKKDMWFEKFLNELQIRKNQIQIENPSLGLKKLESLKKVFLNNTNYSDIMSWTRGVYYNKKQNNLFGKKYSGYYKRFLTDFVESNKLYSKMMYTNQLVNQIRGDKSRKKTARQELWKGQSHNSYWINSKFGILINKYRKSTYKALIEAEKITREKGIFKPSIIKTDFDMDGNEEFLYQGQNLNAYIHKIGANIFELDYLPSPWNYADNMASYDEPYIKNNGNAKIFTSSNSIFSDYISKDDLKDPRTIILNKDTVKLYKKEYRCINYERDKKIITFQYDVNLFKDIKKNITITKQYNFKKNSINLIYSFITDSDDDIFFTFITEMNFSFSGCTRDKLSIKTTDSSVETIDLINKVNISLNCDNKIKIVNDPIFTRLKLKNDKYFDEYQNNRILLSSPITLNQNNPKKLSLQLKIEKK